MKPQPIAIILSASIGIQLQFLGCAIAAEEQIDSTQSVDIGQSVSSTSSSGPVVEHDAGSDRKQESGEPGIPEDSPSVDSARVDSPPVSDSTSSLKSESSELGEADPISPVVPPFNSSGTYPRQIPGPILPVETPSLPAGTTQPPATFAERESKGSLFGNLSKSLLKGGANKTVPAAEQPWWIPGRAFTNDSMVAPYHNLDIAWWDKRPMPNRAQWVRLSKSVTRYWHGSVSEPCFVLVAPMEQVPGNFTFRSRSLGGPRGWLQALSVPDRKGFPQYRYWLDQP